MDFTLNDEQLDFQRTCRRFATEVIRPMADRYDREQSIPWEALEAARAWKLHGTDLLMRMGSDPEGMLGVIYAEELHYGCAGIALAISGSGLAAAGIAASGTPSRSAAGCPSATARATRSSWAPTP
ncbi:MAG: acyl-CoA dehydrogenase family protein [Thermoleophilaceae bacterium]